jgi:hypothetical protein
LEIYAKGTTSDEAEGSEAYYPKTGGDDINYSEPDFTDDEALPATTQLCSTERYILRFLFIFSCYIH